jgi:hypothetical protein
MRITQEAPTRPVTDFEWLMIKTGYQTMATNSNKAVDALDNEVGFFSTEQLDWLLMLASATESHAMQITNIINRELDTR